MTTAKHRANAQLALELWALTAPETVYPGLRKWVFGTKACFSYQLAQWTQFRKNGVYSEDYWNETRITCDGFSFGPHDTAHILFGDSQIFMRRNSHPIDKHHPNATDHEIVTHRLEAVLA